MATVPSQDDRTPMDATDPMIDAQAARSGARSAIPVEGSTPSLPSLSVDESRVLSAMSEARHMSIGVLRARTGLGSEELHGILDALRSKGLATRLNTVVESYSSRFPGLRVGD